MSLILENPIQTVIELSNTSANVSALWARSATLTEAAARWRVYLHQLGEEALLQWFRQWLGEDGEVANNQPTPSVQTWPEATPLDIWHAVDGIALSVGERRVVVMLSEAMDAAEMRVPQEWVDLPGWAGDYYIAAYIDVDEQQLALWGYGTYEQVKNSGHYDAYERTYCLGEDALIQDLSAFWVALELEATYAIATAQLPTLSPVQRSNLIERLAHSLEPRLEIPFELWGALLSDGDARSQLYQKRQGNATPSAPVALSQWTQQILSQGWERLESLLPQSPASSVRSATRSTAEEHSNTPSVAVTGGKTIALGDPTETVELVLAIASTPEPDERRNIRIRLYPAGESPTLEDSPQTRREPPEVDGEFPDDETITETCLPSGVTLALLLTDTAETLQTVESGDRDNYIQLPPFRCPAQQHFSVRVQRGERTVQEDFIS